ncbi:hypothetical protein [Halovivax sp.]|uniref:hypothetical protein n=1 Tax=Halovivax sp. TaxID=1935978 RepID=UPI0025BFFA16|nr:hypothetical protein [Halovivax sp.]
MKRRAFLVGAGAAAVPTALVGARVVRPDDADEPPVQNASTRVQRAGDGRPDFDVEPVCYRKPTSGKTEWIFNASNDDDRTIEATWRTVDEDRTGTVEVPARGDETFRIPGEKGAGPTVALVEDGEVVGVADAEGAPRCRSNG